MFRRDPELAEGRASFPSPVAQAGSLITPGMTERIIELFPLGAVCYHGSSHSLPLLD